MQTPGAFANQSELFASLVQSFPVYTFAKDRDGRFIHANAAYCRKIGVEYDKLIGCDDYDVHPAPLADKYRNDDLRVMENGKTENMEEVWQSLEGNESWVQVVKAPLISPDGSSVIGVIGVFWDITERKIAELALAEERNLLRTLLDNLPDYVYVKDMEGRFLVANAPTAKLLGADSPDDLTGKTVDDFYEKEQTEKIRKDELTVLKSGEPLHDVEEVVTDCAGVDRVLRTTKVPLKSLHDQIIGLIAVSNEITQLKAATEEKKRLEKQLQHAQKMETIGTLTAGIAHDFNNMLSVINGFTELMTMTTPPDHKNYQTLSKVLQAGRGAAKLVGQLLTFSRQQAAQARVIDCNEELEARQSRFRKHIGDMVRLRLHLQKNVWPVRMDPAQLEQILISFTENADEAMPEGGELSVATMNVSKDSQYAKKYPNLAGNDWVCISVRDTGQGISSEVQEHLFEPFFSTKDKLHGAGLGLATVFGIIKQNKGHIFVESTVGQGAEFQVFLPRSEAGVEYVEISESKNERSCRGEESILVVEDDSSVRNLACTILRDQGYTVHSAGSGAEALMIVEQRGKEIDLLLTDVVMPGMNGKIMATEVNRRFPDIKIIFMSGYTDDVIGKYGILEEDVEFIQKPFSAAGLVRRVRAVLDESVV